jgi:uncharacterized protein YigE (DUF2233 family)
MKAGYFVLSALLLCSACDRKADQKSKTVHSKSMTVSACRSVVFENSEFTVCVAIPNNHQIRMYLNDTGKSPYRSLSALKSGLGNNAADVMFAMNAGMYDNAGKPIGYYVENKERLKKLNRKKGGGNFHLLPNGVFSVEKDGWYIRTSDDFADNVTTRPQFATQSGPMLLINGQLHPDISENGESVNIRNAVGIDAQGRAHFVISEGAVSFGKLARMMRDTLKCGNALYFDGSVSSLWYPEGERLDNGARLGPLIVVMKAAKEAE